MLLLLQLIVYMFIQRTQMENVLLIRKWFIVHSFCQCYRDSFICSLQNAPYFCFYHQKLSPRCYWSSTRLMNQKYIRHISILVLNLPVAKRNQPTLSAKQHKNIVCTQRSNEMRRRKNSTKRNWMGSPHWNRKGEKWNKTKTHEVYRLKFKKNNNILIMKMPYK